MRRKSCYNSGMSRMLPRLMLLIFLLCPMLHAAWDASEVVNKFLRAGVNALESEQQRHEQIQVQASPSAPDRQRDEETRGKDMLSSLLNKVVQPTKEPVAERMAHSLKESVDILVDEYKEQYKHEGREYARELGDIVVERVCEDPQIQSSMHSIQLLCWGVVIYLTVVTLVMLWCLLYMRRVNIRLLAAVQRMQQRMK